MSASRTAAAKSAAKIKSSAAATKSGLIDCTTEEFKRDFFLLAAEFAQEDLTNSKNKRKTEESLRATRKRRSNTTPPPATTKRRSLPTPPKSLSKKDHAVKTTCASPSCDEEVAEIDEELMFGEDSADEVGEKSDEVEEDEGEDA
jgi:hypothetical protein